MAKIEFSNFELKIKDDKVRFIFKKRYYFDILKEELDNISNWTLNDKGKILEFDASEKKVDNKINRILTKGMSQLKHILFDKKTIYIDENSEIPLIGSNEFGIVDRGSNILEIKFVTGCNLNCPFCSISEGINDKVYDYLVDVDYLIEELEKICKIKKNKIELNLGPQGEPTLYPDLIEFIRRAKQIENVAIISMNTNGVLLTKELVDELSSAGLTRLNLSLHSVDQKICDKMSGYTYPMKRVMDVALYCRGKLDVLLAPVYVQGFNDVGFEDLVKFSEKLESKTSPTIGIQNYLRYKTGRNIAKELPFNEFFKRLDEISKKTGVNLRNVSGDFSICKDNTLEKPFKKGQIIEAKVIAPGRFKNQSLCSAKNRNILVQGLDFESNKGKKLKLKIVRDKHNIFKAVLPKNYKR